MALLPGRTAVEVLSPADRLSAGCFQLTGHRTGQGLLLEFEAVPDEPELQDQPYEGLQRFIEQIETWPDVRAVGQAVAEQIRAMTGFNRVLMYRFDPTGTAP